MTVENYVKKKEYLLCVDSDGCAMDTMDIKHFKCFGPCMVEEWGLGEWKEEILNRWNEINLYTMTRGINRFKGLAMALNEINGKYKKIEDIELLCKWAEESNELSNASVSREYESSGSVVFQKALSWSQKVNEAINALPFDVKKPFEGVKEALEYAHQYVDIAIVSSANYEAVVEEWELYGLLEHVDIIMSHHITICGNC